MTGAAAERNDAQARERLTALLIRERPRILASLSRWVGEDAEDLLQEATLLAFERLSRLEDLDKLRAWFQTIVMRQASSHLRRSPEHLLPLSDAMGQAEPRELPEHLRPHPCACVFVALHQLRSSYREAIDRVDLRGETPASLASHQNVTPNYARVRLHRAHLALGRALTKLCGTCAREQGVDCDCSEN